MLRLLLLLPLLLGGCKLSSSLFPVQDLVLSNQSTLTVTVRVGEFKPGGSVVTEGKALQMATLEPTKSTTLHLPTGHYEVYAEAPGDGAPAAGDDVTLKSDQMQTMVLNERYEDHLPEGQRQATRVRVLGWSKQ